LQLKGGSATETVTGVGAFVFGDKAGFSDMDTEGAKLGERDGKEKGTIFGCIVGDIPAGLKDGAEREGLPIGAQPQKSRNSRARKDKCLSRQSRKFQQAPTGCMSRSHTQDMARYSQDFR
jgi:hypothetical protein